MEFIRKHTEGPFAIFCNEKHGNFRISGPDGVLVIGVTPKQYNRGFDETKATLELYKESDSMLNYIIERSEYIHKILVYNYGYPKET